jgi:putative ABC transport system permease protein
MMLFLNSFFRTLIRHKAFTFINLFGLTFSLAFILLIGVYLIQEKNFDRFNRNIDQLYMVLDSGANGVDVDYRIKQMLLDGIPEIEGAAIFFNVDLHLNYKEKVFKVQKIVSVDNDFFKLFHTGMVKGDAKAPFKGLDEGIISESLAKKIFVKEDPIGKQILFNHEVPLTIVGVVKDFPENSSFKGDFYVNAANPKMHFSRSCESMNDGDNPEDKCTMIFHIMLQLRENASVKQVEQKAKQLIPKDIRFPAAIQLFPYKDFHLTQKIHIWNMDQGNPTLLKILAGIVLIIGLLAIFNYVNLTTAGYKLRFKETGVKKGLGAQRKRIILEYLMESVIICLIAAYLATLVARLFIPGFNGFLNTHLSLALTKIPLHYLLFFSFSACIGLIAGIYPALYISLVSPRDILSSGNFTGRSGKPVRNILNVAQFTIAIGLITIILFMQKQIRFAKHRDLGFNTEQLLRLNLEMQPLARVNIIEDKLRALPRLLSVSSTAGVPGEINMWMDGHATIGIDSNFYKTFNIQVIDGRKLLPGDVNKACLINETAWKNMEDRNYQGKKVNGAEIVGVVKDFHINSMHTKIEPLMLCSFDWLPPNNISIRISKGSSADVIESIQKIWNEVCPEYPFQYNFYDAWFDSMYKQDEDLGKMISLFAILAIVISCMGIFGMALFSTEQRGKEIGVRKVNGASRMKILYLLTRDFTKWIFLSFVLSIPLSWYPVYKWMSDFAYHTQLSWWVFVLAGLLAFFIAIITVAYESWRAASKNPVEILRYE